MKCPKCQTDNPSDSSFCAKCGTQIQPASADFPGSLTETLHFVLQKELATGNTFAGRYQIVEELGHGGMGRVYKVFDTDIKEKVALKLLRPEIASDRETIERFSNELKYARKISHRNVCRMYDLGKVEGTYFITMEYVHGEDLKSMIRMSTGLTIGTVLSVGKQICDGLAEAHSLGVVHRDLKPQNIMIDKGGNAKIMDFGIARSIREKGITGPSVMIGTPEYMSPEQAEAKEVDHRSDIYSLGIILYEMATGRVPFEGATALSIAMKHKGEIPKNPKQFNPNVPDDLSGVILKCLEKDKAKRYQTAAALREEIERIEKGLPTTERVAPETKARTSREITVKFQPKKLIIPALAFVAIIIAAVVFWPKKASNLDPNLVAVAVFENKTGEPKLDPIGNMAAERIMQGLTQVDQISVAPMPSTEALSAAAKGQDKLRHLAEATKAGKIVHGDYYLQGDKLQFHAWVQDMIAKKNIVPLEPVSGPAADPAMAFEPLRLRLMGGLAGVFDPVLKDWLSFLKEPPKYEAYREYIEGSKAFFRSEYPTAVQHFLRASEHDPSLKAALLYASIALGNMRQYAKSDELIQEVAKSRADLSTGERLFLDWRQARIHGDIEAALRSCRQIVSYHRTWDWTNQNALEATRFNYPQEAVDLLIQLDPNAEVYKNWTYNYWSPFTMAYHMLGNYKQELKIALRARKQLPELLSILFLEGRALAALGRIDDLQKLFEESKTFPADVTYSPGTFLLRAGRELSAHGFGNDSIRFLNQALQWFENRPEQEKTSIGNRDNLARTLYALKKWDDAKALFEGLYNKVSTDMNCLGYLGAVAARMGDREGALKISKELEDDKQPYLFGNPTYWRARIAALLGDKEGAVNLLRQAIKQGYFFTSIHPTEDFESLADYPPYIQFMKPKG